MNLQQLSKVNFDITGENEVLSYCASPDAKTLIKQGCLSHLFIIFIQLILAHQLLQKNPIRLIYYQLNKPLGLTPPLAQMILK